MNVFHPTSDSDIPQCIASVLIWYHVRGVCR